MEQILHDKDIQLLPNNFALTNCILYASCGGLEWEGVGVEGP